ncbi:DoxX family protein [Planctomicrobium sp. SH527]|uniref:DoxX family protein n=1 Tax=Planctomicrobium sp. SH527 TaxID=3448123 RepID=UPI003F5C012C
MLNSMVNSIGLLVLRVSFGMMMLAAHGYGKLMGFSNLAGTFPDPLGIGSSTISLILAIFAEFFCSVLIVLGLFTRLAAIPLIVTMLVAITVVHGDDPWAKKELAVAYLAAFTTILITGSGPLGLDRFLGFRKKGK